MQKHLLPLRDAAYSGGHARAHRDRGGFATLRVPASERLVAGGYGAGWAGQAAFAVVGGLLLGFLAGFLTAG